MVTASPKKETINGRGWSEEVLDLLTKGGLDGNTRRKIFLVSTPSGKHKAIAPGTPVNVKRSKKTIIGDILDSHYSVLRDDCNIPWERKTRGRVWRESPNRIELVISVWVNRTHQREKLSSSIRYAMSDQSENNNEQHIYGRKYFPSSPHRVVWNFLIPRFGYHLDFQGSAGTFLCRHLRTRSSVSHSPGSG